LAQLLDQFQQRRRVRQDGLLSWCVYGVSSTWRVLVCSTHLVRHPFNNNPVTRTYSIRV
jgi:hypothetical protein